MQQDNEINTATSKYTARRMTSHKQQATRAMRFTTLAIVIDKASFTSPRYMKRALIR